MQRKPNAAEAEKNGEAFGYYDLNTQKLIELGRLPGLSVSAGDAVVLQGNYYTWWSYGDGVYGQKPFHNIFFSLNPAQKKLSVIRDVKDAFGPFVYMKKVSEDVCALLTYSPGDGENNSKVELFSASSGEMKTMIEEHYENTEQSQHSAGRILEAISANNGLIFALGRVKTNQVYEMHLMIYSQSGQLQKSISAPAVMEFLGEDTPLDFRVIGDFFALRQASSVGNQIFKMENDTIVPVTEVMTDVIISAGSWSQERCPYFYWLVAPEGTAVQKKFSVLDTRSGVIRECHAELDTQLPSLSYSIFQSDENGNLLLGSANDYSDFPQRVYMIKRQVIDQQLGQ
jgi:hypothetical protein